MILTQVEVCAPSKAVSPVLLQSCFEYRHYFLSIAVHAIIFVAVVGIDNIIIISLLNILNLNTCNN